MKIEEMRRRRDELARRAVDRYRERSQPRDALLAQVEKEGVLAAAGVAGAAGGTRYWMTGLKQRLRVEAAAREATESELGCVRVSEAVVFTAVRF